MGFHPYDLPLYEGEETDNIFSSSIIEDIISTPKPSINYIGINLAPTITEQTSTSYVHEITHSQLDNQIGVIKEFYHAEILSMFNELFHASILDSEENILRLNDSRRLYEMKILTQSLLLPSAFTREDLLLDSQYLIYDLKAYNLFIKFYYGNETLKEEIISDIQSVFEDAVAHRVVLSPKARVNDLSCSDVLADIIKNVDMPAIVKE